MGRQRSRAADDVRLPLDVAPHDGPEVALGPLVIGRWRHCMASHWQPMSSSLGSPSPHASGLELETGPASPLKNGRPLGSSMACFYGWPS